MSSTKESVLLSSRKLDVILNDRNPINFIDLEKSKKPSVHDCVNSFLRKCKSKLPSRDFFSVEKKVNKQLKKLDPMYHHDIQLRNSISVKEDLLATNSKNIYIYVKEVIDQLKKINDDTNSTSATGDTTSDWSENEASPCNRMPPSHKPEKKRATLTTISSTLGLKSNSDKFNRANGDKELNGQCSTLQEDEAFK